MHGHARLVSCKFMREKTTDNLNYQGMQVTTTQNTKLTISNNTVHKRTNNMSSRSAMEDGPRKSPRKTAGNKPHYLAKEYNKDKGGKGGKKMGGGRKKRAKECNSSSEDDSDGGVSQTKKSRGSEGGQKSRGGKSIGVSTVVDRARVTKPKTGGAKGKMTLQYDSEDFSSGDSIDSTPKATIVKRRIDGVGKHSIEELLKTIQEKDKEISSLELELSKTKVNSRMNKTKV
jgi:hypothetical protein